jgi:hypothetical protein
MDLGNGFELSSRFSHGRIGKQYPISEKSGEMNNEIQMSSRLSCIQDTKNKSCILFLLFPAIIFRPSSRCFKLGCQQTPEYGRRQAQPLQHLGKAQPRTLSFSHLPSSLLSLAEPSIRNNIPHSFVLSRLPSFNLPDFLSFTALDRIWPHLVWCGSLQLCTAPSHREICSHPGWWRSKMKPMAKILMSHPHRSFVFDQSLVDSKLRSLIWFHSLRVCFRQQDAGKWLRSAFAGLWLLRPPLLLFVPR